MVVDLVNSEFVSFTHVLALMFYTQNECNAQSIIL